MPPDPPSASRLRRSLKFPVLPNNLSLIARGLDSLRSVSSELALRIIQNVNYLVPVIEVRTPPPPKKKILATRLVPHAERN